MPAEPGGAGRPQGLSWSWQLDFGALMAAVNGTAPPRATQLAAPRVSLLRGPARLTGHGVRRHGPGGQCSGGRARRRCRRRVAR